jgi:hypothetical protein
MNSFTLIFLLLTILELLVSALITKGYFGELIVLLSQPDLFVGHLLCVNHVECSIEEMVPNIISVSVHQVDFNLLVDDRFLLLSQQFQLIRTPASRFVLLLYHLKF